MHGFSDWLPSFLFLHLLQLEAQEFFLASIDLRTLTLAEVKLKADFGSRWHVIQMKQQNCKHRKFRSVV